MPQAVAVENRSLEQAKALSFCQRMLEALWLLLAFSVPLFFYPGSNNIFLLNKVLLFRFLVSLMVAFWVMEAALEGWKGITLERLIRKPLLLPALLLGVVYIISTAASISPRDSFFGSYMRMAGTYTLLSLLALFLIISQHLRTKEQLQRLLFVLLLSSGIVSLYGVLQHYGFDPMNLLPVFGNRVTATMGNPIFLGAYLLLSIPLALALLLGYGGRKNRRAVILTLSLVLLLGLQLACLWFTQSRGPFLGLVAGLLLFALLLWVVVRKTYLLWGGILASLVAILLLVLMNLPAASSKTIERLTPDSRLLQPAQLQSETARSRFLIWQSAVKLVVHPQEIGFSTDRLQWLRPVIGYGPETQEATFPSVYLPQLGQLEGRGSIIDRAHNRFLDLAVTVGLLGLASYLFVVVSFFFYAWRHLSLISSRRDKLLLVGIMSAILGSLVEGFFGLDAIDVEMGFWLNLALMVGVVAAQKPGDDSIPKKVKKDVTLPRYRAREVLALVSVFLIILFGAFAALLPFRADIEARKGLDTYAAGDIKGALPGFSRATELAPNTAIYWGYLGQAFFRMAMGMQDEGGRDVLLKASVTTLEEVRKLEPLHPSSYSLSAMVHTYWAEKLDPGQWDGVMRLYEQATRLSPYESYLYNEWALALMKKGDFPAAGEKLKQSLALDPGYGRSHFLQGIWLARTGKFDDAAGELALAVRLDDDELVQVHQWTAALAAGGDLSELERAVGKVLPPDDWVGHSLLATVYFHQGKGEASSRERQQALSLATPEERESLAHLFRVLTR